MKRHLVQFAAATAATILGLSASTKIGNAMELDALPPLPGESVELLFAIGDTAFFYVPSRSRRSGNIADAVVLGVFSPPGEVDGGQSLGGVLAEVQIDCDAWTVKETRVAAYNAEGQPYRWLDTAETGPPEPDSVYEELAYVVCRGRPLRRSVSFSTAVEAFRSTPRKLASWDADN